MLGELSAKYESNSDPGIISNGEGDAGGISYGAFQFASNTGSVQSFVAWLQEQKYPWAGVLAQNDVNSLMFKAMWQKIAQEDTEGFLDMQCRYTALSYYYPAKALLAEAYYNLDLHSEAIRQVVYSAAVQYGAGYIVELFETACHNLGYGNLSYVDSPTFDADIIKAVYDVRASDEWTAGSPDLRPGLRQRFADECQDALAMLG